MAVVWDQRKTTLPTQTTVYVNKYYEKTGNDVTLYYYLGDRLVALKKGANLRYVVQDHLTGTSTTWDNAANPIASIKYFPWGDRRNSTGTIDTERQFTGQRLDGTGLYYYGARYYDPGIGRFISADSIVPSLRNPQNLNRYSYVNNNPTRYTDPTGHCAWCAAAALGGLVSGTAYTLATIGVVYLQHQDEGVRVALWQGVKAVNGRDFLEAAAIGALTAGVGTVGVVTAAIGRATLLPAPVVLNTIGGFIQQEVDVLEGQTTNSGATSTLTALLSALPGAGEMYLPVKIQNNAYASAGVGIADTTASGIAQALLGSPGAGSFGQGAGIIGGITVTGPGSGTDDVGNSLFLVSIEGESPIWVTSDNANSMLSNGENLVSQFK